MDAAATSSARTKDLQAAGEAPSRAPIVVDAGKHGRWLVEIEDPTTGEQLTEQLLASGHASRMA